MLSLLIDAFGRGLVEWLPWRSREFKRIHLCDDRGFGCGFGYSFVDVNGAYAFAQNS